MKKLVSALTIATLAFGTANAVVTAEQRKQACDQLGDYIWDKANEACVLKDACNEPKKYKAYCNSDFKKIQVSYVNTAKDLVQMYVKEKLGVKEGCIELMADWHVFGQDYVGCVFSNGSYMSFEFNDIVDFNDHDETKAICTLIFDGEYSSNKCKNITRAQCDYWTTAIYNAADKECIF